MSKGEDKTEDKSRENSKNKKQNEEEEFSKLHRKFVDQNLRMSKQSEEDIMLARLAEKASKLKWVDYLYPYHLMVSSHDNLVFVERTIVDTPSNINSYYRKRNSLP